MEMTPEEIEETDRQHIRREFELAGLSTSEKEVEGIRRAMLKVIILKQIAAAALVDEDSKDQEMLIAIYTAALSSLVK
ncbi:MAG: hypothetical protein ACXQTP_03445 [Candidatus Methanofastidiosia archaeon]